MVRCSACGTENAPGAAYCAQCARKLDEATQAAVQERRASYAATGIAWARVIISLILVVIIIAVVAFLVIHGV